jgi:hypothetical protein
MMDERNGSRQSAVRTKNGMLYACKLHESTNTAGLVSNAEFSSLGLFSSRQAVRKMLNRNNRSEL